ncbi:hypothetical protein PV08_11861 [Exophiala spinifera]|uniref:Xylanolytic transcriptional activator regulatory domain-containing protein n=1 Tax=Exophiala spinifera TaxID=91928 RepID=A0A0D1Y476_9EURO|nr:uncharacterized protein PV08_11861 [Exophiala spinifera]KIW09761.1 hypothetical protein PV08_11861 [Exophiala spinifera]
MLHKERSQHLRYPGQTPQSTAQVDHIQHYVTRVEYSMRANPAGSKRRNATEKSQYVGVVVDWDLFAFMETKSGTKQRSTSRRAHISQTIEPDRGCGRIGQKLADCEALLKVLANRVPEPEAKLIKAYLGEETARNSDTQDTDVEAAPRSGTNEHRGTYATSSEGSTEPALTGETPYGTKEDFTRKGATVTGFMGPTSEVTWMQTVLNDNNLDDLRLTSTHSPSDAERTYADFPLSRSGQLLGNHRAHLAEADHSFTINSMSYHLDDTPLSALERVEPYDMPQAETAQFLFYTYLQHAHSTFPVIGKSTLTSQFHRFLSNPFQRPPDLWLAIINTIFAIAARYASLVRPDRHGNIEDHLVYFNRARYLAINSETLFDFPDLQLIQVFGLMSFYFLCTSQINRAWVLIGIAMSHATALGLNLRNDSTQLKDQLKEIRYRVWWSLYVLQHRLCIITGRVTCVFDQQCSTPLPVPLEENEFDTDRGVELLGKEYQQGPRAPPSNMLARNRSTSTSFTDGDRSFPPHQRFQSSRTISMPQVGLSWAKDVMANPSLYFLHLTQLARLSQSILSQIHSVATSPHLQSRLEDIEIQLEDWARNLPPVFDFRCNNKEQSSRELRLSLGFFYYGTQLITYRSVLDGFPDLNITRQSKDSDTLDCSAATRCVEAAKAIIHLVPDESNAEGIMQCGPWWSVLPWLVQSTSVLIHWLSFPVYRAAEGFRDTFETLKRAIRLLHVLGEHNLSASRAWSRCDFTLRAVAAKADMDLNDLPEQTIFHGAPSAHGTLNTIGVASHEATTLFQHYPSAHTILTTTQALSPPQSLAGLNGLMLFDPQLGWSEHVELSRADGEFHQHATY